MTWFLPVVTGLLLVASFPKAEQGYFAWIAFSLLIAFIWIAKSPAVAFAGGFVAGIVQLFFLQIWIPTVLAHYGGLSGVLSWIAYGLMLILLALFPGAACLFAKSLILRGGDAFLFSLPFIWAVMEYALNYLPFGGYPWILAGYSQSNYLRFIQIADVTGVYGISFLVLFFNVAVFWMGLRWKRRLHGAWPLITAALLIVLCVIYGNFSLRRWSAIRPDFRAAMLQANISYDEPESVMLDKFERGYLRLAERLKSSPHLLLIPESPSPVAFESGSDYRQAVERLAKRFPMGLVFNNVREEQSKGNEHYYNSAYFLNSDGKLVNIYDKMHLVPFGEYIPLQDVFRFIKIISKDVSGFSPGRNYQLIKIGERPSNAIICFEIVFPGLVRGFVRKGSQLILNLTNDGWYGDSSAPYQHLTIARWRAIENRRFLLRAANSGISAFIEPTGRIQTSTGILQEAVCEGRFAFIGHLTFYSRYGDVFVFVCAIIACGFLVLAFSPKRIYPRRVA
jgi:apolipoprotein N-acyltransferase